MAKISVLNKMVPHPLVSVMVGASWVMLAHKLRCRYNMYGFTLSCGYSTFGPPFH